MKTRQEKIGDELRELRKKNPEMRFSSVADLLYSYPPAYIFGSERGDESKTMNEVKHGRRANS